MDIWSWICELPNSDQWVESESPPTFQLVSSKPTKADTTQSIQLRAERTSGSNSEALVTFSVYVHGFHPSNAEKTLWVSDACPLASDKPFLPLLLQLVQEIVSRSPTAHDSTCPRSQLQKLRPEPVAWSLTRTRPSRSPVSSTSSSSRASSGSVCAMRPVKSALSTSTRS
ncbi:hypothetical protein CK203_076700 [Vitis vinifera]|uniref:Uncharacterized protein n=1 Tax=Vitis vinifera TaxID=29760 RepID=A0A438EPA4_VITVI|nr:hypothetical protein CK203_076700 [Vitis vinifera]